MILSQKANQLINNRRCQSFDKNLLCLNSCENTKLKVLFLVKIIQIKPIEIFSGDLIKWQVFFCFFNAFIILVLVLGKHFIAFVDNKQPFGLANSPINAEQCKFCRFFFFGDSHHSEERDERQIFDSKPQILTQQNTKQCKSNWLVDFSKVYVVHFAHKFVNPNAEMRA